MLNNILKIIFLFLFLSCADDSISGSEEDVYPINQDNLDIITWNIQNYPKHSSTNTYLTDIINNLEGIDIIALQEIENATSLIELANSLEGNWEARRFQSGNSGYGNLAFLINSDASLSWTSIIQNICIVFLGPIRAPKYPPNKAPQNWPRQ